MAIDDRHDGCGGGQDCDCHKTTFRNRLICAATVILVVVVVLLVCLLLVPRPHKPRFYLQDLTVSCLNVTPPAISATMQATVAAINTNDRAAIYYDEADVYAEYRGAATTSPSGPPNFSPWTTPSSSLPPSPSPSRSSGYVLINIRVDSWVRWKVGNWISGHHHLRVNCPALLTVTASQRKGTYGCLCTILVTAGILAAILYFIFRPHMIAATVDSASLAHFTLAAPPNALLRYNLTVGMTVRNPNKRVGLCYDGVESAALLEGQRFGSAPLDSFCQTAEASSKLAAGFHGQQVIEGDITQANFRAQQSAGVFSVEIKLAAKLHVKLWILKLPGPSAKMSCPLSIPAPGSSSASFQPTGCRVWF